MFDNWSTLKKLIWLKKITTPVGEVIKTVTGAIVAFKAKQEAPLKSLTAQIVPVQSGTGDPSPDNVRPISGWTGLEGKRTGKNLLPEDYYINASGTTFVMGQSVTYSTRKLWLKANVNYTLQVDGNSEFTLYMRNTSNASVRLVNNYATFHNVTFTVSEDGLYAIYAYKSSIYGTFTSRDDLNWWQLEVGSTASAYEQYQGESLSVSWSDTAGTVYGGNLTVDEDGSGVLTVDKANIASYAGETLTGEWISDRDVYAPGTTPTIGAQVVYLLATPLTYTFSNLEQLTTLIGKNNIWADTGDVSVTYIAN